MEYRDELIDRLAFAAQICKGQRVLDIGGQHPMNHNPKHPFGRSYRAIFQNASQYEIFDMDAKAGVQYVGNLDQEQGRALLRTALDTYQPQVVLCMEILEHLKYPCAVMDILAAHLEKKRDAQVFITIPNNANWILNMQNWHAGHNVAFFRGIAARFVEQSDLGRYNIVMRPCMQKYKWYWWIIYLLAFCQPINWGFHITAET